MDEHSLLPAQPTAVVLGPSSSAAQNPALVYLAGLSAGSRRTMRQALNVIAGILTAEACDLRTLPWGALRFQHTQARLAQAAALWETGADPPG